MPDLPNSGRRRLIVSLACLPAALRAGHAVATPLAGFALPPAAVAPFPETPRLLVAGPDDGVLNRWADALQPALQQSLPPDTMLHRVEVGSADGVTGANQFEVRSMPDGTTVMLVPGEAALAWLVGDPRAQFDVGHWVPVMAGTSAGVLVGRPSALAPGRVTRIAAAGPGSADLPALLGCHLLGVRVEPVFGLNAGTAVAPFGNQAVDAVLLRGQRVPEQFAALAAAGAQALFTLGALDNSGRLVRDARFPGVPHFVEYFVSRLGRLPAGPLYDAWTAAAAATRLDFGLVLQQLTPAALVALWRQAGADAAASYGVRATAATLGVHPLAGPDATANARAIAAGPPALLELRRWLSSRFNWQPG